MKRFVLHPAWLVLLAFGCGGPTRHERIDNVRRVMMHDLGEFSLEVPIGGGVWRFKKYYASTVNQVYDLSDGQSIWAEYSHLDDDGCNDVRSSAVLTIHLHAPAEIEGGGWNRGKFGQGQINAIE